MEENNVLTNEEVVEVATEVTSNPKNRKWLKITGVVGLTVLTGVIVYKYAKRCISKKKAELEGEETEEYENPDFVVDDSNVD